MNSKEGGESFRGFFPTVTRPSLGFSNVGSAMSGEGNRAAQRSDASVPAGGPGALDRKVLIVEDEPDLRELLTYNLTAAGFNVQATENGTDGLAAVQKFAP